MPSNLVLRLIHSLYLLVGWMLKWTRSRKLMQPLALTAPRSRLPAHLCLNLIGGHGMNPEVVEDVFLECLRRTVRWSREVGIKVLTVYDRDGVLVWCQESIRDCITQLEVSSEDSCESELEYPLTPPLSEPSDSRSQSPESAKLPAELAVVTMKAASTLCLHKQRNVAIRRRPRSVVAAGTQKTGSTKCIEKVASRLSDLTLYVVSRNSAKPAIACAAGLLLRKHVRNKTLVTESPPHGQEFQLSALELGSVLEGGLPPPDLMIVHSISETSPSTPLELHGFPPWQIMLTEFHHTHPEDVEPSRSPDTGSLHGPVLITATGFCRALDEYASAQFRLGR